MSKTAQKITKTTTPAKTATRNAKAKAVEPVPAPTPATSVPTVPQSKQAIILDLLKHPQGATVDELMQATGWQRHSVYGTLSGVVKKRLGLNVVSAQEARGRIYRITGVRA